MNLTHLSQQERRHWLLEQLSKGSFASVTWSTKSSGLTTRTVKQWIEAALASGDKNLVNPNVVAHKPQFVSVTDMEKFRAGDKFPWSNINVDTLVSVKVGGKEYYF